MIRSRQLKELSIHVQMKPQLGGREKSIQICQGLVSLAKNTKILPLIMICSRQLKELSIHVRMKPQLGGREKSIEMLALPKIQKFYF